MSSIELIARYLAERARLPLFVPLAVLLAVAGRVLTPGGLGPLTSLVDGAAQAFVLVLAFRVWDDLEDRARDTREHPRRVMVTSKRTAPFVALLVILTAAGVVPILLAAEPARGLASLGAACGVLLAWYRLRGTRSSFVGGQIVLLKYPAIAIAVAPTPPSPVALVSLYLVISAYEAFDDPVLRASLASLFGKRLS